MDRMTILKNPDMSPNFCPVDSPRRPKGTFKTVGELIEELSMLNPDTPALFYSRIQIRDSDFRQGYVPYTRIDVTNVIEKDLWYERSDSPEAYEVVTIF